jgi:L-2-hydroxyglutarate oxidase LhgO
VVIGAGVVGLAVAARLASAKKEVVVLERHESFGKETSSRNSEVVHAGMYYPPGSLKAKLCVEGNRRLYELCAKHGIPHRKTGKFIIANSGAESEKLFELNDLGSRNGTEGLAILSKQKLGQIEPNVKADLALYSPSTGIVDTHQLMKFFQTQAEKEGAVVGYNCTVKGIQREAGGYRIGFSDADGRDERIAAEIVVNCAGLDADTVAAMAGIDIDKAGCRLHPCKGEYFAVAPRHKGKLSRLVYPAPTAISLGIHVVLDLGGALKLGPNAFYTESRDDYRVDPSHQGEFFDSARRFLPFLEHGDLSPDMAGIRPKLQGPGMTFRDFVVAEESSKGLPGLINCIGIESPGLTASPALAEHVAGLVRAM